MRARPRVIAGSCSHTAEVFIPRTLLGGDGHTVAHACKDLVGAARLCIPMPVLAAAAACQAALLGVQVRSWPAPAAGAAA